MIKVAVLFGGVSGEHEVSLCSAASVINYLDKNKYHITAVGIDKEGRWHVQSPVEFTESPDFGTILRLNKTGDWLVRNYNSNDKFSIIELKSGKEISADVVFPVVHGTNCEDGRLQGFLEMIGVPFVGADSVGSVIGMDKDLAKRLLRDSGIPVVPWKTIINGTEEYHEQVEAATMEFGYPLFVKPARAGSSVGVYKVNDRSGLDEALAKSSEYDWKVLIEKAVEAREIECSVLGNFFPEASIAGEIIPGQEYYSYEAKYINSSATKLMIPADITDKTSRLIRKTAVEAYKVLNCSGMARVDFFMDRNSGDVYLNEINTLPGFTSISMYPKLWEKTGLAYPVLLDRLIELAFSLHKKNRALKTSI